VPAQVDHPRVPAVGDDERILFLDVDDESLVRDMLDRTGHAATSWVLVETENKQWARVKVAESVMAAIDCGLATRNLPDPGLRFILNDLPVSPSVLREVSTGTLAALSSHTPHQRPSGG
jgi:hypothetical protein